MEECSGLIKNAYLHETDDFITSISAQRGMLGIFEYVKVEVGDKMLLSNVLFKMMDAGEHYGE